MKDGCNVEGMAGRHIRSVRGVSMGRLRERIVSMTASV